MKLKTFTSSQDSTTPHMRGWNSRPSHHQHKTLQHLTWEDETQDLHIISTRLYNWAHLAYWTAISHIIRVAAIANSHTFHHLDTLCLRRVQCRLSGGAPTLYIMSSTTSWLKKIQAFPISPPPTPPPLPPPTLPLPPPHQKQQQQQHWKVCTEPWTHNPSTT